MQFSPDCSHVLTPRLKYFPHHADLDQLSVYSSINRRVSCRHLQRAA